MIEIRKMGSTYVSFDTKKVLRHFGNVEGNKVIFMQEEALYLAEKGKAKITTNEKRLTLKEIMKGLKEKEFMRYVVYKDLRDRGYIAKEGIKFGGDFIVYEKGKVPGKDHSTWVCLVVKKEKNIKADEIVRVMRIAHSTNKALLLAVLTPKPIYYELKWKRI